jgi:hypothetical protein
MGLKGRKYLEENFSRAVIGEKLVRLLEEIISDPNSDKPKPKRDEPRRHKDTEKSPKKTP